MAEPRPAPMPDVDLRSAVPADAPLLCRWREEPSVRRFQPLGELSLAQLRADLGAQRGADLRRGRGQKFQWIVVVDGEPAGWITLVVTNWDHGLAEIGYALSTPYQRRGIMPVALRRLLGELFEHTSLERIEARCAVANAASARVLEAVGFVREGLLRDYFVLAGERVDNYLYAVLREDLAAQSSM